MSGQDATEQFELLKSQVLDGRLSEQDFLARSQDLGVGPAAFAWLRPAARGLDPSTPITAPADAADTPPTSDGALQQAADQARVIRFAPRPEQFAWTFGGVPPVLSIRPGEVLKVWTEDAFAGHIRTTRDLPSKSIEYPFVNPQTGPFYVEGAEIGDTLAIHLLDVQPAAEQGVSTTIPLFGSLSPTQYTQLLSPSLPEIVWIYKVDPHRREVLYQARESDYSVAIPLTPFHGTLGVAPRAHEARNVLVPEAFGGNMDAPEVRAGTTVYLGVNVPGALFSLGDGHYAQGQGEVCGVAVEGCMYTSLIVELIKGSYVDWPRLEDDAYLMTAGSYRPLEDCFRIAITQMVRWVSHEFGLSQMDAYQLATQVGETQVANVVDANYTILAKLPKRYLPRRAVMGNAHARLRAIGQALGQRGRAEPVTPA